MVSALDAACRRKLGLLRATSPLPVPSSAASYDKRIILWDIGVPDKDYTFQASQLLTLDTTSTPLRLCPVASCPDAYLLAGCEGGCCCWDVRLDQPQKRR